MTAGFTVYLAAVLAVIVAALWRIQSAVEKGADRQAEQLERIHDVLEQIRDSQYEEAPHD